MLIRLLIFTGLLASSSPVFLDGQSLNPPSSWDRLVGQALDSCIYTVEVEYLLVEIATGDRYGQGDLSYFNRIPLVGVAADSMIWTANELVTAPWRIDPDFEEIIGRERFRPEVSAVTIIDGQGRRIVPDTSRLPADSSFSSRAIAYVRTGTGPGLPILEGPLPEKLLFVTLTSRGNGFSYNAEWETVSPGRREARRPEVAQFDEHGVTQPTLLLGVHPTPGNLRLDVLGLLFPYKQLNDPYVLIPPPGKMPDSSAVISESEIPLRRIGPPASSPVGNPEVQLPGAQSSNPSTKVQLPGAESAAPPEETVQPTVLPGTEVHDQGKKQRRQKKKKNKGGGSGSRANSILPPSSNSSL